MKILKPVFYALMFLSLSTNSTSLADGNKFLHTHGHDIVDGDGNKVLLRGIGLGNWLLPEGYMWKFGPDGDRPRKIEKMVRDLIGKEKAAEFWQQFRRNYITENDIKRIAELGFNSVRPALNARLFLTEGDSAQFIEDGFILIDNLVRWCRKYGIYVIIDMHGAPGGQTGANIDDSIEDQPGLFMDIRNQDRLVDLWVKIAKRYSDEPTVIAYNLLNEPLPRRTGAADKYGHLVEPLYKRITTAIREVDTNHMITLEGIDWSNDWSIFSQPFDDNVFYQFHYYCWNRPDNLNDISKFLSHREKLNTPVWVGETGEKGNTIYWATTQYFEANNIGWSFWPWKKMDTKNTPYSIKRPENWEKIVDYSHGKEKPSSEIAQSAFNELIENIKLSNCVYFPDVVNSIFRRTPVKIEAENYGHQGYNTSYYVADTSQRAKSYRVNEPVPIELINFKDNQYWSEQCIVLNEGDWVNYNFDNYQSQSGRILINVNKKTEQAGFKISLNGKTEILNITQDTWHEVIFTSTNFKQGQNQIKLSVTAGVVCFDWLNLRR